MDWLFRPLIFVSLFSSIFGGRVCLLESCSSAYRDAMEAAQLSEPEKTQQFCDIIGKYRRCVDSMTQGCRGDLSFHGAVALTKRVDEDNCRGAPPDKGSHPKQPHRVAPSRPPSLRPSCRYFGAFKFRSCSLFGDPHLKTFDGVYQTCRTNGTWTLINNSYVSVHVTNRPVLETSAVTAPTKMTVVIKSSSTPCTLEKRYSADGGQELPSTFDDGTDRPGPDETVSLHFRRLDENRETVDIYVKYIATQLTIRRVGRYLAFSARLPEEVLDPSSGGGDDGGGAPHRAAVDADDDQPPAELCVAGCPAAEQLNLAAAHQYVVGREQALTECARQDGLEIDLRNTLTDSYLDWCLFDVMTSGVVYDFVAVAHAAQAEALETEPRALHNRTVAIDLTAAKPDAGAPSPSGDERPEHRSTSGAPPPTSFSMAAASLLWAARLYAFVCV